MPMSPEMDPMELPLKQMLAATRTTWHDIGQLLTVIMAEAQFLHRSHPDTPELQDGLEHIAKSAETIAQSLKSLYQSQVAISDLALDRSA